MSQGQCVVDFTEYDKYNLFAEKKENYRCLKIFFTLLLP